MKNENWLLVFFEISSFIGGIHRDGNSFEDSKVNRQDGEDGRFKLAKKWTNKFIKKYKDAEWGIDLHYYDTLDEFLETQNKIK